MTRGDEAPAWLAPAAAGMACAAFLLVLLDTSLWHPGYAYGDERVLVSWLQDLREGAPLQWQFSRGCLTRALQWLWVDLSSPALPALHTPGMAALAAEWLLLVLVARRWFGDEAAAWSLLASSLSAQTWVRARSLLAFQTLPMEVLLLAFLAGHVKGRASALAWGALGACLFLDYDGSLIAVPALWLCCLALEPAFRRWALYSGMALGGLGLALMLQGGVLESYVSARLGQGLAASTDPGLSGRLHYLGAVFTGGAALPYFGVSGWPGWPPWAWVGLGLGAWGLLRSKGWVLVAWAAGAVLVTQMVHSGYGFPVHRLVAAAPALAIISGVGLASLRQNLGSKAWILALLLALGGLSEGWAWWRQQAAYAPELYDRCQSLVLAKEANAMALADPSVRLVTQLDGDSQADARFVMDRPLALTAAGASPCARVLALVPADYAPALKGLDVQAHWYWVAKGFEPALVVFAQGPSAVRLSSIEDKLAPVVGLEGGPPAAARKRADDWLRDPVNQDPWARTAAVEASLQTAGQAGTVDAEEFAFLTGTAQVSAAPWMVLARSSYLAYPRDAIEDCRQAEALDPSDGEALLIEAACRRSLGDAAGAEAVSRHWVDLRAGGDAWRHTL